MQRLFSTFPAGGPGAGLLLLRIILAIDVSTKGLSLALSQITAPAVNALLAALAIACLGCGLLIVVGLISPIVQFVVVLGCLVAVSIQLFAPSRTELLTASEWQLLLLAGLALCGSLLGPGAYSLDAKFFGRQQIHLPTSSHGE